MSANPSPRESWPLLDAVLSHFGSKRILTSSQFEALGAAAKARAGGLSGVWETKFVQALYDSIGASMRGNLSSAQWTTEAQKIVDAFGGGKKLGLYSGEKFSPWYAETVFRTNVASALAAGKYADLFSPAGRQMAGFVMLSAIHDHRNEDEKGCPGTICRKLDGIVFPKDDPGVGQILTPLHFGCRCTIIELDSEDVAAGGYEVAGSSDFADLLATDGVWSDDKLESLVMGQDAPLFGVDVTGLENQPSDSDLWGNVTAGHDVDPLSYLVTAGFDDAEIALLRSTLAAEARDAFASLGVALENSWGELGDLSAWDRQQFLALNTYLDNVPPVPEGTLYRAARMSAQEAGRLVQGATFRPDSFFMATSYEDAAIRGLDFRGGGPVAAELRIEGQTSARSIELWAPTGGVRGEVLFKPGTEFRIVKAERDGDYLVVTLREI